MRLYIKFVYTLDIIKKTNVWLQKIADECYKMNKRETSFECYNICSSHYSHSTHLVVMQHCVIFFCNIMWQMLHPYRRVENASVKLGGPVMIAL